MDAPGLATLRSARIGIMKFNFEEYVRVRVDGVSPQGSDNINSFSRASARPIHPSHDSTVNRGWLALLGRIRWLWVEGPLSPRAEF